MDCDKETVTALLSCDANGEAMRGVICGGGVIVKNRQTKFSIAVWLLLGSAFSPAMAGTPVELGNQVIVNKATLGCPKPSDMRRVIELLYQQDQVAAVKFAERQGCRQVLDRVIGVVAKSGRPTVIDCLRPRGEIDCFWIARLRLTVVEPVDYDPFPTKRTPNATGHR
jgi:hypothetical protein